jgi:asparagine synthase (glutamine-hydrolysing)
MPPGCRRLPPVDQKRRVFREISGIPLAQLAAVGGIVGKVGFDPRAPLALGPLEQMIDASARSVDTARALYTAPGVALGTAGSRSTAAVIASGRSDTLHACAHSRLTNAGALRRELDDLGHTFDGTGDDELILRAYAQWGRRAFSRLRGPFACAIWDSLEHRLLLARDHIGIHTLYFAVLPDQGLVFASDIRALLRDPGVRREWSPAAIDAYLTLGYVPAPLTAYRRVSKLEAAHLLIVEGRRLHVEPYWDVPTPERGTTPERDLVAGIAANLRRTAAAHTGDRAAAFLYSGGTASTALLSASCASSDRAGAAPAGTAPLLTVTVDQDAGDIVRSGRAASMLGRAREIESPSRDVATLARQLAAVCDEPVGDPAAISQALMCAGARRHAAASIAAHGAATLWAGHARHRVERIETLARTWLRWPLASLSAEIGRSLPDSIKGARALTHLGMPPADAYAVKHAYGLWDDDHRRTLYTRRFAWDVRDNNPFTRHLELYARRETTDPLDRALYVDAHTFLPDSMLPMATVAARAVDLELRFPMLDVDVVECAAFTPTALKQRGQEGMYALRAVLARELPASLMPPARRVPARHPWLGGALTALVPPVLLAPRFDERGIVSRPALRQLWTEHQSGRRDHAHRLWSLLMLELWFRDVIDGNAADVPVEYAILAPRRPAARTGASAQQAA